MSATPPAFPPPGSTPAGPPPPPPGSPSGAYATPAEPARSKRGRVAALVAGAVVLVGGGTLAAVALSGDDGGGNTPEAAVEAMFEALNDEDVLGMMDALAPGERESLVDPMQDIVGELRRLGVLSDEADLGDVDGVDFEFSDLTFQVDEVADDVAQVRLSGGRSDASYDLSELPLGDTLVDTVLGGERPEGTDSTVEDLEEGDEFSVTTVRRDGDWYVSLWYSVAEAARTEAGMEAPAFGQGIPAVGAGSASDAVRAMVDAMVALDVERMIELTPPDEMAALHDYGPLFVPDAEAAVDQLPDFDVSVDELELTEDVDGDVATVGVERFAFTLSADGESASLAYDGECVTITVPGQPEQRTCPEEGEEQLEAMGLGGLIRSGGSSGVRVVEVDGDWYVSPTRSLLGVLVDGLSGIEEDGFRDLMGRLADDPESLLGDIVEGAMGATGGGWSSAPDTPASTVAPPRATTTVPASTVPPTLPPTTVPATTVPPTAPSAPESSTSSSVG